MMQVFTPELFRKQKKNVVCFENCVFTGDFSDSDFSNTLLKNVIFEENVVLPKSKYFFQILNGTIDGITFPKMDLGYYNLKDVRFKNVMFHPETIFPEDEKIFSVLELRNCEIPIIDMNNYKFTVENFRNLKFHRDSIIPKDKSFFKTVSFKRIVNPSNVRMPFGDYSEFDFEGANFAGLKFTDDSILPRDNDLFHKITGWCLSASILPNQDFSMSSFEDVYFQNVTFAEGASLPKNRQLFQQVRGKTLYGSKLPSADYSDYDFSGVKANGIKFTSDSIIPLDFMKQAIIDDVNLATSWPTQYIRDVFLLDVPSGGINLSKSAMPPDLLHMMYAKYRNRKNVILPPLETEPMAVCV